MYFCNAKDILPDITIEKDKYAQLNFTVFEELNNTLGLEPAQLYLLIRWLDYYTQFLFLNNRAG